MVIVYVWYSRVCAISKILFYPNLVRSRERGGTSCAVHLCLLEIQDVNSYQEGLCLLLDGSRTSYIRVLSDRTWGQVGETC
jgi:hypothetical protein